MLIEEKEADERKKGLGDLCLLDIHSRPQLQFLDNAMRKLMLDIFEECIDYERGTRYRTNDH